MKSAAETPRAIVLGTVQDGGYPHAGCRCARCEAARRDPARARKVAALGLVDAAGEGILVEAGPDLPEQVLALPSLSRILLTHAHLGHVAGLLWLGKEAMAVRGVPLSCGRRLFEHLAFHEPWRTLVRDGHVLPGVVLPDREIPVGKGLFATPLLVPHRAEWSETFAWRIRGPHRTLLWLPDIDRFDDERLRALLEGVDVAFLDGTFWSADEVPGRDLREIPHPLVPETAAALARLGATAEVSFLHLNHTNPLLDPGSEASRTLARLYEEGGLRPAGGSPAAREGLSLAL